MTAARIFSTSLLCALALHAAAQERREISFRFEGAGLDAACDTLVRRYGLPLVYLDTMLAGITVSAECSRCTEEEALTALLEGTGLIWRRTGGQFVLVKAPPLPVPVHSVTIAGTVRDSVTGEDLPGAAITLARDSVPDSGVVRSCAANQFGYFVLRRVTPGSYRMVVRCLGYRAASVPVAVSEADPAPVDVRLVQESIPLGEVVIEGRQETFSAADGISRGVYIPSVPSEQHQYYLDGAAVYNPAHFGGVLSTFNPGALRDVEVKAGGLPPSYGGRIGGVLDLAIKDGTMERFSGSAGTSSLGSHLTLEGPATAAMTFMVSGRRGYPDLFRLRDDPGKSLSTLNSSEVLVKFTRRLSPGSRLSLGGYFGDDGYDNTATSPAASLSNDFSWRNASANLQWTGVASPSLFLQASAGYTYYDFDVEHLLADTVIPAPDPRMTSNFRIGDAQVRADAEHFYDDGHTLRGGVSLVHHGLNAAIDPFSLQIGSYALRDFSAWEFSLYLQDQWRVLPDVTAELGVRATSFQGDNGVFSGVEPRFSLLARPAESFRISLGLTAVNQFLHPYRQSGIFLFYPAIFWYASSDSLPPSSTLHLTLAAERDMAGSEVTASAELFYAVTRNLHEFLQDPAQLPDVALERQGITGTGRTSGAVLGIRKRTGRLTGSLSYTLAWATHQFARLNGGEAYVPRFNRRHQLQLDAHYALSDAWAVGAIAVLASDQSPSFSPAAGRKEGVGVAGTPDVNGSRLAGFQRIEIQATHFFSVAGLAWQAGVRLLNDYGLYDPFTWSLQSSLDPRLRWQATLDAPPLTPRNVVASLGVRF